MTRHPLRRAVLALAGAGLAMLWGCGLRAADGASEDSAGERSGARALRLLEALERAQPDTELTSAWAPEPAEAHFPTGLYLLGEAHLRRGEVDAARARFAQLVDWSGDDPYGDGRGGSGLVAVAWWRWLRELETELSAGAPLRDEAIRALDAADRILDTHLARGMFSTAILGSAPQVREDIFRLLARLAWRLERIDSALDRFLAYLRIARSDDLTVEESAMLRALVERRRLSAVELDLFRARRLLQLGRPERAAELAHAALGSETSQQRAEARLLLASIEQRLNPKAIGSERGPVVDMLGTALSEATDRATAERALYERSRLLGRRGPGQDVEAQERDLALLRERFPRGSYVDDALLDLARRAQSEGDLEVALARFAELRELDGPNDYFHTASFQPAMILLARGESARAAEILADLRAAEPDGPYWLISTFWLARIAEERGAGDRAEVLFRELIDLAPFEYQALRARMHLAVGPGARSRVDADPATCRDLRRAFEESRADARPGEGSVYHRRPAEALESGLYRAALAGEIALHTERRPPARLESLSADELARLPSLPRLALLLALRQDALAARDLPGSAGRRAANRLRIAAAVTGEDNSLDTPLALRLAFAAGEPQRLRWETQREPAYPATAYPRLFIEQIAAAGRVHGVPPELMYAVARRESLFFPAALSPVGALGLFQLVQPTFDGLDRKHSLLAPGVTWREYLLDPRRSTRAVALLFAETLDRQRRLSARLGGPAADELFAIMEHNAGYGNVRAWREELAELRTTDDLEFVIDNIRAAQTRVFTRNVLSDLIVARAAGIFGGSCAGG